MTDLSDGAQVLRLVTLLLAGGAIALFLQRAIARQLRGRTRAEQLLQASQAQIAGILAIAADAIITIDDTHSIVHFNRGAEDTPAEASISKLPTATGMLFCVVLRDATEQRRREQHDHMLAVAGARLAASLHYGP